MMNKRAIIIVLDSVGIGSCADSCLYGDEGCNTLKHVATARQGLHVPAMQSLGLGNLEDLEGVEPTLAARGSFGKLMEKSKGKDTTTGHWEMMGIVLERPFPTYPNGFPDDLINQLEELIGRKTIGNVVASGTEIIARLGQEHVATGFPIVYTSADSVMQIAAHEEIIPLNDLYEICRKARELMIGEHAVGRVIARPFIGVKDHFVRTPHRHDFSLEPPPNILDDIVAAGQKVIGVGKIKDIFAGRSISENLFTENNQDGINKILELLKLDFKGLLFANLIDFDQLYGHRNDVAGYALAIEEFDKRLPSLMQAMAPEDILFICADHGCDPTTSGTDHTREMVPLLVYGKTVGGGIDLGIRSSFADLGQTVAEYLEVETECSAGHSFYDLIRS